MIALLLAIWAKTVWLVKRVAWFCIDNYKVVLPIIGVIVLLILVALAYRGCKKRATIDLQTIDKINNGNRQQREEELRKVIYENADVVKTVDERNTIAEANRVDQDRVVEEKIKEADRKIVEARSQGKDITGPELECLLTGVCQ